MSDDNKNIFKTASQILEGWKNKILPDEDMKDFIENTSEKRMSICNECPFISTKRNASLIGAIRPDVHCTDCGCTLSAKTRCLSCSCPQNKWVAEMSKKEEDDLKKGKSNDT